MDNKSVQSQHILQYQTKQSIYWLLIMTRFVSVRVKKTSGQILFMTFEEGFGLLTFFINSMVIHRVAPHSLLTYILVPIPKDRRVFSNIDDIQSYYN